LQNGPDIFCHQAMALGTRVDTVREIELLFASDTLKQKRDQKGVSVLGDLGKNSAEGLSEGLAHIRGRFHSGENELHFGIPGGDLKKDGVQITLCLADWNAAQSIVASEGEHKNVDRAAQDPIDASQSRRGGLTAQAGIDDLNIITGRIGHFLDQGGVGLFGFDPISGGQAVSEEHDDRTGR